MKPIVQMDTKYLCFHKDFAQDRAESIFETRFGQKPETVIVEKGWLYLGPVPKGKR